MDDDAPITPARKASPLKTIVFCVVAVVVVILLAWTAYHFVHTATTSTAPTTTQKVRHDNSPDQVQQKTQTNDQTTSPSGTGPGSDNSILGQ